MFKHRIHSRATENSERSEDLKKSMHLLIIPGVPIFLPFSSVITKIYK